MTSGTENWHGLLPALLFALAALASAFLVRLLHPLLVRYALARPNKRSSHRTPTPQGGGIAVIGAAVAVLAAGLALAPAAIDAPLRLVIVLAAAIGLALVGAVDDIRPIDPLPRLFLQALAVAAVLAVLPAGVHIVPALPVGFERALLFVALLWFVNLTNFMDGIDWITVAELIPVTAALAFFGAAGALPAGPTLLALALCGALLGFAPFNRPVARLFLGDVGSLPLGLLVGWLLVLLAAAHPAAALLLPLYYLADATLTLLRRFARGEAVMQAHRSHFYQRALDGGLSVYAIVGRIFAVNVALAGLAALTLFDVSPAVQAIALLGGAGLVAVLLRAFARAGR